MNESLPAGFSARFMAARTSPGRMCDADNALFRWRRYPAHWNRRHEPPLREEISHDDVVTALRAMDSFVDVTEEDLVRLVRILSRKKKR